jgi:succinoglycan biosynthesis protein ExoA
VVWRLKPDITVVVPVLDEGTHVGACLDAIAAQDLPLNGIEVLVVDGGSTDNTVRVCEERLGTMRVGAAGVIANRQGTRPANLNAGLAHARGRILCRVDARSRIPRHYLRQCRDLLDSRPDLSVVGGRQRACAPGSGVVHVGIARALNNRWATGLSRYRRAVKSGPSDTVYLGSFRTDQLRRAGGWRADLPINEDFDLNRRLARDGLVWFDATLVVDYVPRDSLRALLQQHVGFGRSKVRYWRLTGDRPRPRQVALLVAPAVATAALSAGIMAAPMPARATIVVAGAALALGVEIFGSDSPRASVGGHVAGVVATTCVAAGWLLGVWGEMPGAMGPSRQAMNG